MLIETTPSLSQPRRTLDRSDFTPLEISPEAPRPTFREQLFELRRIAKLHQRTLALGTGIDHSSISRLEKENRNPNISTVVVLVEALKPDLLQTFQLIASLAKEDDKAYINDVFDLSGSHSDLWRPYVLNTGISEAVTPAEKVKDYAKRRKRTARQIAEIGGIDHTGVSRLLKGERGDILGASFISLVRGLGLTQEQIMDLFYSFGPQGNGSAALMPLEAVEQKVS